MSKAVKKTFGGATLLIALFVAPDANAQHLTAQPVLQTAPAGPSVLLTARPSPVRDSLFKHSSGLGISTRTYTQQDGSIATQRGLFSNFEIGSGLEAGVGLFSVNGDGRKHNEFKRSWSVKRDVTPKNENVAAVGMRFRF